jgi:hypothetical protein
MRIKNPFYVVGSNDIQWNIREYDGTQWNITIIIMEYKGV